MTLTPNQEEGRCILAFEKRERQAKALSTATLARRARVMQNQLGAMTQDDREGERGEQLTLLQGAYCDEWESRTGKTFPW